MNEIIDKATTAELKTILNRANIEDTAETCTHIALKLHILYNV